jgi:8-oxo-dGTP pyrophosphatase MutT (NUDIX family)
MTTSETYPTNDPERLAFHADIRKTMQHYLELFPDEEDRQSELQSKLANPELDLRLRSTIPDGHMCASGIILLPDSKILMLEHKALGIWVVPGGHYDLTDKNLAATAMRETVEETGILNVTLHPWHVKNGVPLDIDTHPIPERKEKGEGAHQHFDFRYILEIANPEETIENLRLDANEIVSFKIVDINEVDPASSIAPALKKLHLVIS